MLDITFFPARYGDSIWISYGTDNDIRHILIDGGTGGTASSILKRMKKVMTQGQSFELVVVTHVDRDHIEGLLSLLERNADRFRTNEFWFNAWEHLSDGSNLEVFGAAQGERLTTFLQTIRANWNRSFKGKAVVVGDNGEIPAIELPGGLVIKLLSPYIKNLQALKPVWAAEVLKAGLIPGGDMQVDETLPGLEKFGTGGIPDVETLAATPYEKDTKEANGSSIAFLICYDGKKLLLAGDSHSEVIENSLNNMPSSEALREFDLFKVSHHGSKGNTSPDLFKKVKAKNYLISTNGAIYKHPDRETIARLLKSHKDKKQLIFNYPTDFTKVWDNALLKQKYNYETIYGEEDGITISL